MKKRILLFAFLHFIIFTYAQTGKPDLAFGVGGSVRDKVAPGSVNYNAVAVQLDGKIIIVGSTAEPAGNGFLVVRYNPDGTLDQSFSGDGRIVIDYGLGKQLATSVAIQTDGKILVTGTGYITDPFNYYLILARFNGDGSPDNSFNGKGWISINNLSGGNHLAVQDNGKIVVAGDYTLTRFKTNGLPDSSFGTNGSIYTRQQVMSYAVASYNEKILVGGGNHGELNNTSSINFAVGRFNNDGKPDSSFDANGLVSTAFGGDILIESIAIQPNGKIIAGGSVQVGSNPNLNFALARYNTDGSLDNTFDGDGKLVTNFSSDFGQNNTHNTSIALQQNGKIIVAGSTAIARYNSDGSLDNTFDGDGKIRTDVAASSIAILENKLYVVGRQSDFGVLAVFHLDDSNQSGLYYKYYEGNWNSLPDFNSLTPAKSGTSANVDISVRTPGRNDNFAFIWQGYINITTPGNYTFETVSDDGSKLYFNTSYSAGGAALVNNDGIHAASPATGSVNIPSAGVYPISFTYFEKNGEESMQVYWTGPGIPRQRIPNAAFVPGNALPPSGSGLNYKYYEGSWSTLPDFTTLTPVKTGGVANVDIGIRTPGRNDNFAFVWEGYINIPTAGDYTFSTISDDGSKLYFNSLYNPTAAPTVNNDGLHPAVPASGTVHISTAGAYPIAIAYFEKDGDQSIQVQWSGPGLPAQAIPSSAFTKAPPVTATNGLTYKYYEGSFNTLPDFNTLTPVKTGNSPNVDINQRTSGRNDNFAFIWEGYIKIETPGTYTFETSSDDGSRLYFNTFYNPSAVPTVDNNGLHAAISATGSVYIAAAGVYPISITFFEKDSGESMQVYWSGPGFGRQQIPDDAFTKNAPLSGLNYRYYEGNWNSLPDFSLLTPVKTGSSPNLDISLRSPGRNDNFGFVWEGFLAVPTPGAYTLELVSDDGSKLYFNSFYFPSGDALINNDGLHAPKSAAANIMLYSSYPIAISYFDKEGPETMQFYWTGPGIPRQPVPNWAFTRTGLPLGPAVEKNTTVPEALTTESLTYGRSTGKIYPNPFADRFTIDFYNNNASDDIGIAVYDLNGRKVYDQHHGRLPQGNNIINVNLINQRLKDGIYVVTVNRNGLPSKTIKLVKQQ